MTNGDTQNHPSIFWAAIIGLIAGLPHVIEPIVNVIPDGKIKNLLMVIPTFLAGLIAVLSKKTTPKPTP